MTLLEHRPDLRFGMTGRSSLADLCLAGEPNPWLALAKAVEITRWKLISTGRIQPAFDEELPAAVWHARDRFLEAIAA